MSGLFDSGAAQVGLWFLGAGILGLVLAYGAMRAGSLTRRQRSQLDANTRARQQSEDPQKTSGVVR